MKPLLLSALFACLSPLSLVAQNPILPDFYADPAARVPRPEGQGKPRQPDDGSIRPVRMSAPLKP